MNRDELIYKWLNHELTPEKLEAFKALDDYEELTILSKNLQSFKAPSFDVDQELKRALTQKNKLPNKTPWLSSLLKIAAILVVGLGVFYYTTTLDTTSKALIAQKVETTLPDDSEVTLNALSTLSYNDNHWKDKRLVNLDGEAFFKVQKGATFDVITSMGSVTVLGTQFNVKQRTNLFEVTCYEGSVQVTHQNKQTRLKPGDTFLWLDGKLIATEKEMNTQPSWLTNVSTFKSMPLKEVILEMERQYPVSIKTKGIDVQTLFTGSFPHDDLEIALKAVSEPLQLHAEKKGQTIILTRD